MNTIHHFSKDEYISYENGQVFIRERPRYRVQWDHENGKIIGYWVWTCNCAAIKLKPSWYVKL